jgi:ATPases of the AAA+ class
MNPNLKKAGYETPAGFGISCPNHTPSKGVKLKIEGVPKILSLYKPEDDLTFFNRIAKILDTYGISKKSLIMSNPFDSRRLEKFISSKVSSYGGILESRIYPSPDKINIELYAKDGFAEIEEGIYYLNYDESYICNCLSTKWIIFDLNKNEWSESSLISFIKRFSKKLRKIKFETQFQYKEAFDSIFLPDEVLKDIREDLDAFLMSRSLYKNDLELTWRRGYMLVGPPGNGKTLLVRKVCEYYGLEHFDIRKAIERDGSLCLDKTHECSIDYFLYPEEEKPRVCVLEDIDKFVSFQSGEVDRDHSTISLHDLLKGLDGIDQTDDIILFATTNFPDILHEALIGRPGRFDKIYKIDKPNQENICKLLRHYKISIKDGSIEDIAKELKGLSMAFATEFVKTAKMKYKRNEIQVEEARVILKAIHDHQELCKNHFKEPKSLGFKK